MGRHRGATCKFCRRQGEKLFLRGDKCFSEKCPVKRRAYAPGLHGKRPVRISEYGIRLREKQKARMIYGLSEAQFRRYFEIASREKGITGDNLLSLLERRLDNVVYRFGFANSRQEARQIVGHGHIKVNGRGVNIPSYSVRAGQAISPKEKTVPLVKKTLEKFGDRKLPAWLDLDPSKPEGTVVRSPKRDEIDTQVQESLIVEFYSR
ncbi:MAG: 30S ribosomal protein S4 [Candidatus Saganbacteria bacterium]|nr:30S ribosomal protein S4 [Candidatus Saganbacteria bacterium]